MPDEIKMFYNKMNIFLTLSFLILLLSAPIVSTVSPNDAGSDGGDDFDTATPIFAGNYQGYLESPEVNDYYRIYVYMGYTIDVSMTPPVGGDFDLYLYYTPNVNYPIDSSTGGGGVIENVSYTTLISGNYFIRIFASEGSGTYLLNVSILDIDPPEIWITSPTSGSYAGIVTNITGTSYDFASGVQKVEVKIDDEPWQLATGTTSWNHLWDTTGFFLGSDHTITARATDNDNNAKTRSVDVTVDNVAPTISIISPKNGSEVRSSTVDAIWSGSDTGSGISRYEIRLDGGSWIIKGIANHNFTGVSDGSHTVHFKVIDKAGNSKEAIADFTVNTSLILGPGWVDDILVFGGITVIASLVIYLIVRKWTPPPP
ncbi:MAG: hypothetical protein H3Z50_01010 [archaeon]|nr:hypothetical protein [archaeon]